MMEIWDQTSWYVELVYNVLLFVLPTVAGLAVSGTLGLGVVRFAKQIWREFRPAVDEPTDLIVRLIAQRTGRTPGQVSKFIVGNIDAIIATLPEEAKPSGG